MAFFESRLPERYSFGASGGPRFSTEVVKTGGGQMYANGNWLMPLHMFDVSQLVKDQDTFDDLKAFFMVVGGRRDGFRFKDWSDYRAEVQPTVAISVGTTYQLLKRYTFGARTYDRPIYKPVSGFTVYRTRSGVSSIISPTVDNTTGVVTVSGHVGGDVYKWSGEFDVPVRFTSDILESVIENKSGGGFLISWPSVGVEEFRL